MTPLPDSVAKLYEELNALVAAGKEEEAKDLLVARMSDLPEDLRADIMLDMFADGLESVIQRFEKDTKKS